ncbi:hypothetical protein JCM11251_000154 [Rhodosporidiobolus azoricus]
MQVVSVTFMWLIFGVRITGEYTSFLGGAFAIVFWPSAVAGARNHLTRERSLILGGPWVLIVISASCRVISHAAGSYWLKKLNKLVPILMPVFAVTYFSLFSPFILVMLPVQIFRTLRSVVRSKHGIPIHLRRPRRTFVQVQLDQLVKRLVPQGWEYGRLESRTAYPSPDIASVQLPALNIEASDHAELFQRLVEESSASFRLGIVRYFEESTPLQPRHGASVHLGNDRHALLLNHLNIAFTRPWSESLSASNHRLVFGTQGVIFLPLFSWLHISGLVASATVNSVLRALEMVALPSLSTIFPEMYSEPGLLLNDPSTFARDHLGLRSPSFDSKRDRILSHDELLANPDLQAFFTSFALLFNLVKRLGISNADFLKHWDHAFDAARMRIDLARLEHDITDSILEAVLVWKEVQRDAEEEPAKKKNT